MDNVNQRMEDEVDKHFPKGHKERGKALLIAAIANIELEEQARQIFKEIGRGWLIFGEALTAQKADLKKKVMEWCPKGCLQKYRKELEAIFDE